MSAKFRALLVATPAGILTQLLWSAASARAAGNIATRCDWAHSFSTFIDKVAGEIKGVAYVLGPAAVVILVVFLIFAFRSNARGGLAGWIGVIVVGLFLLGIVGTLTGAISTGGC